MMGRRNWFGLVVLSLFLLGSAILVGAPAGGNKATLNTVEVGLINITQGTYFFNANSRTDNKSIGIDSGTGDIIVKRSGNEK